MSGSQWKGSAVVATDTVFEMEIGTNRPDAMNHYGVAGEGRRWTLPLNPIIPGRGTASAVP